MQQVEAGKIDLDADVNRYLDFKIPPFEGKPITMRNLMTHTPGFEEAFKGLIAEHPTAHSESEEGRRVDTLGFKEAGVIGVAQVGALFAGISRSGITMVAGLVRGLDHEDAARFSFLLATPIIFAAGVYKVPDLTGHLGDGIRGQALVGSLFAAVAAYVSIRFLMRFFETRNLLPFAIYCLAFGAVSVVRFA